MLFRRLALGLLAFGLFAHTAFGADRYAIDPVHTLLGFSVRHLMINNVRGKFTDFSGTIVYDEGDITHSSVGLTIKAASIDTGVSMRDNDLRSPNFFDVAKYPTISFQSRRIEKRGDTYVAVGALTMHGVSKEIEVPISFNGKIKDPWGKDRIGIEGSLTLNRRDWDLTYSKAMDNGGLIVGNEVKIELAVEATKQ